MAAKLPILASMLVSLLAPLLIDRICVKLFDPELHKARKAGPPLGPMVRHKQHGGFHRFFLLVGKLRFVPYVYGMCISFCFLFSRNTVRTKFGDTRQLHGNIVECGNVFTFYPFLPWFLYRHVVRGVVGCVFGYM